MGKEKSMTVGRIWGKEACITVAGIVATTTILKICADNSLKTKNSIYHMTLLFISLAYIHRTLHPTPQTLAQACALLLYSQ